MKIVYKKYRIIKDEWLGYEVQIWRLWYPFWIESGFSNTFSTIKEAIEYIENGCKRFSFLNSTEDIKILWESNKSFDL